MMPKSKGRPPWDYYFLKLAEDASDRATCERRKVGAIFVNEKRILTSGYNGSPKGMSHCTDVGCEMREGHCVRTIHAEQNAIIQAALYGIRLNGSTVYCTCHPCYACAKALISVGVQRVVYLLDENPYIDPDADRLFRAYAKSLELPIWEEFVKAVNMPTYRNWYRENE